MGPNESLEERNRRLEADHRASIAEQQRREIADALAPPPTHFVAAARELLARDTTAGTAPAADRATQADAASAASLATMRSSLCLSPAAPAHDARLSTSLARMQAATGLRTN